MRTVQAQIIEKGGKSLYISCAERSVAIVVEKLIRDGRFERTTYLDGDMEASVNVSLYIADVMTEISKTATCWGKRRDPDDPVPRRIFRWCGSSLGRSCSGSS
jgi:hypothetical protein